MLDLNDLMFRHEALNPALVPYLSSAPGFPALRHPLVYMVPYFEQAAAMCNQQYAYKRREIRRLTKIGDYSGVVPLFERPYRTTPLMRYGPRMTDTAYWATVGWAWCDTENAPECWLQWQQLMSGPRAGRHQMMTEEEQHAFGAMPDIIPVYRGQTRGEPIHDFSWTLDITVANWFANRYNNPNPIVLQGVVQKTDVIAYLSRRNEFEILVFPDHVMHVVEPPPPGYSRKSR